MTPPPESTQKRDEIYQEVLDLLSLEMGVDGLIYAKGRVAGANYVGIHLSNAVAHLVDARLKLAQTREELTEAKKSEEFLLRLSSEGGAIVSSAAASVMEIAQNRATGYWHQIGSLGFSLRQPRFLEHFEELREAANLMSCAFCGHTEPKGEPGTMSKRMIAHIANCEKHPLIGMFEAFAELRERRETELREAWRNGMEWESDITKPGPWEDGFASFLSSLKEGGMK